MMMMTLKRSTCPNDLFHFSKWEVIGKRLQTAISLKEVWWRDEGGRSTIFFNSYVTSIIIILVNRRFRLLAGDLERVFRAIEIVGSVKTFMLAAFGSDATCS
ncbi:hypothetical protein TNCV_3758021 [Trichonephila clavipes]|nr:hypothetical protein TNCV_3758021 [Trichonephila clavipes]